MEEDQTTNSSAIYPAPVYLRVSSVKKRIQSKGRRPSAQFIHLLDKKVERLVDAACKVHNGGKKTLDATVAGHIGLTRQ